MDQVQGQPTSLLQLLKRDEWSQGARPLHQSQKRASPIAQPLEHGDQGQRRRRYPQGTPTLIKE
jgi:hypothetical protein